jgi:hypothetical protein
MSAARYVSWRKSSYSNSSGNCIEVAAGWRKSSYSDANGGCVEVASGDWRKSSFSGSSGNCVEVAGVIPAVAVRDTKQDGRGPVLEFGADLWRGFLAEVKSGRFDPQAD